MKKHKTEDKGQKTDIVNYRLLSIACWVLFTACLYAEIPKDMRRMLESGEFEKYSKAISEKNLPSQQRNRKMAWLFLYTGNYSKGFQLLTKPSEDFLYKYLEFMTTVESKFLTKESEHFKVRYFPQDEIMVDFALKNLGRIYQKNGEVLGYFPTDKVLVEIYPDKELFAVASTLGKETLEKSGTVGICKFNRIMLLSPRNLPLGYRWLDTLSHEYCHFLINRITKYNCPLWLHEGISRYTDTMWRSESSNYLSDYSKDKLKKALSKKKLIPFEKMSPSLVYLPTQDDISLAFAQVSNFVDFFVGNFGKNTLKQLLSEMRFMDEKKAFRKITKHSFGALYKKWLDNLSKLEIDSATSGIPDIPQFQLKSEEDFLSLDAIQNIRLGDTFRQRKDFSAALYQYERAYSKDKSPVVAVKIAKTKLAMGKIDEAKRKLLEIIKGNENYITPYLILSEIAFLEGEKERAKFYIKEAFSINPFYPGLHTTLKSFD